MNVKLSKSYLYAIKWLLKAVSTDKDRPTLQCVNVVEAGMWEATDGYKIHRLSFKQSDYSEKDMFDTLKGIEPGLYRVKIDGNFAMIEQAEAMDLHFPDTFAITVLNRKLSRPDADKLKPEDLDVCHLAVDPALLGETLSNLKGVTVAHIEIGQMIHVQAEGVCASYLAIVMPMFCDFEEYGLNFHVPQLGRAVWKPGMKKTPAPVPVESMAILEPAQV
jgi:hypothetical protein